MGAGMPEASIIDFRPQHAAAFRDLNLAWIRQHWEPEEADYKALERPREYILASGGQILLAELAGEIVGTCALLKMPDGGFELAKMTVADSARGLGIGKLLMQAAIERARSLGAYRVFLESNNVLETAIALYEASGFSYIEGVESPYTRCNVQMELRLRA
jgi:GNAT superfamily N-acetyltransferase